MNDSERHYFNDIKDHIISHSFGIEWATELSKYISAVPWENWDACKWLSWLPERPVHYWFIVSIWTLFSLTNIVFKNDQMPDGGRVRHSLYYIYIEEVLSSVLSQGHLLLNKSRLVFISSTQFTPIPEADIFNILYYFEP
jgi:hypothetical protein